MVSHQGENSGRDDGPQLVERYRRLVEPALRGPVGVAVTIGVFVVAGVVGGWAGLLVASAWVLLSGAYCLANFWHCRETHCVVTGSGWTPLGLVGLVAALTPALPVVRVWLVALVYLGVLAGGYGLQAVMAARTGRQTLDGKHRHAPAR